jgi:hypothetical protein
MSFTVDVHHHILPDVFWRATNDAHSPVGGILPAPWSKASTLSYMDDAGIDVAITSISTPGVHMGDDSAARDLARRVNELSAELIQERPDRFGGFAALPLPDVEGALRALEYGLDVLKLDGVVLSSNARGIYLGDTRFGPLFDELERCGAVVFVHPTSSQTPRPQPRTAGFVDRFHGRHDAGGGSTTLWEYLRAHPECEIYFFSRRRHESLFSGTFFNHRRDGRDPGCATARDRGGHASQALLGHGVVVAATCPADASFSSRHGPGAFRLRLSVSSLGSSRRLPP